MMEDTKQIQEMGPPSSRKEATEAALGRGASMGTKDVCVVLERGFVNPFLEKRYPNLLLNEKLNRLQRPRELEGLSNQVWAAFQHNIVLERIRSFSMYCTLLCALCVPGGVFFGWADELGKEYFPLLFIVGLFLLFVVIVIWLALWIVRQQRSRMANVVSKMSAAMEREGYWITIVETQDHCYAPCTGYCYVQFTLVPGGPGCSSSSVLEEGTLRWRFQDHKQQPYSPQSWAPLEGTWERVKMSPFVLARQSWMFKVISNTLIFKGTHDAGEFRHDGTIRVRSYGCFNREVSAKGRVEGNTLHGLDLDIYYCPLGKVPCGRTCYVLEHTFFHHAMGSPRCVAVIKGNKMKVFQFPYMDCPSDDELLQYGLTNEEDLEAWELYERTD